MDLLLALIEPVRTIVHGGEWKGLLASEGFQHLLVAMAFAIPSSLIALGIGTTSWRETPVAAWLGINSRDPAEGWAERARDTDGDGRPDF